MQKMESETATYMYEKMTSMTLNGGGRKLFWGWKLTPFADHLGEKDIHFREV